MSSPSGRLSACEAQTATIASDSGGAVPLFGAVDELVVASDLVLVGTVTDVACARGDVGSDLTVRTAAIDVEQTWRGDAPDRLELVDLGDDVGAPIVSEGVRPPLAGERAVWFLERGPRADGRTGWVPVGTQGRYLVRDGRLVPVVPGDGVGADVAGQIAAMGLDGLHEAVAAASADIRSGRLASEWKGAVGDSPVSEVRQARGSGHCGWQDTVFVWVEFTGAEPVDPAVFLVNPEASFPLTEDNVWSFVAEQDRRRDDLPNPMTAESLRRADVELLTFDPNAALPDRAIDTGWRRGATHLWIDRPNGDYAFLQNGSDVQRLPRARELPGCE